MVDLIIYAIPAFVLLLVVELLSFRRPARPAEDVAEPLAPARGGTRG